MVCDALMEIMGDKLEQRIEEKVQTEVEKRVQAEVEKRVQEIEGINALYATLIQLGRQEEIMIATTDENYRKKLLEEFNIG